MNSKNAPAHKSTSEMEAEVATVVSKLGSKERKVILQALSVTQHFSGPLPNGETIRIYNEVIPNGGDRLMNSVEKQLEHRISIEYRGVERSFNQSSTGQWMGFCIALAFGLIAWDLAKSGHDLTAQIIGGMDIVSLATAFIIGKVKK